MLPIAALIIADATGRTFAGMDLNERAALVASDAGIHHCYFKGSRLPDLAGMRRLRERGAFTLGILGGPRVFASVPNAEVIVVIDARTIVDARSASRGRARVDDARRASGAARRPRSQSKGQPHSSAGWPRHIGDGRRQRHELRRPGPAAIAGRPRADGPQPARCGASTGEGGPARRGDDRRSILPRARFERQRRQDRARIRACPAGIDAPCNGAAFRVVCRGDVGAHETRSRRACSNPTWPPAPSSEGARTCSRHTRRTRRPPRPAGSRRPFARGRTCPCSSGACGSCNRGVPG